MYTYLVCCSAEGSVAFSVVVSIDKEIRTVDNFYESVPMIQQEVEKIMNMTFSEFGVLSFSKLEDK